MQKVLLIQCTVYIITTQFERRRPFCLLEEFWKCWLGHYNVVFLHLAVFRVFLSTLTALPLIMNSHMPVDLHCVF